MKKGTVFVLAAVALLAAGWWWRQGSVEEATTVAGAASLPSPAQASSAGAATPPVPSMPAAASAPAWVPRGPFENDTAADLLRKVQLGMGQGSAQEAAEAASVLQFCAHAAKTSEALQTTRGIVSLLPESLQELIGSFGGITDEQVERAQGDARRCQVFDEATLARRGELFQKAYEGGASGAAMPYLTWLTYDGKAEADPAVVEKLQAEVRQAAREGDFGAMTAFAFMADPQAYGMSRVDREAYKEAWLRITEEGAPGSAASNRETIAKLERFSRLTPLTDEQQRAAEALAKEVYEAYRRRNASGG